MAYNQGKSNELSSSVSISDEILKTIHYALEKNNMYYDKTFVSVVKEVNSNGTYVINDTTGSDRTVKCAIPGITLHVGQNVYAKIPSGNINRLHICGVL